MKIPKEIEVAGIVYNIKKVEPEDPNLNHGNLVASQNKMNNLICLSNTLNDQQMGQSFTHEVVHAICDALDVSWEEIKVDERFVESFSQLLYQVIKQL